MEIVLLIIILVAYLYSKNESSKATYNKQIELRKQNQDNAKLQNVVKCPKCLSTQISSNKQGITVTTGLIGSQNVWITCLQCGHKWKAGH